MSTPRQPGKPARIVMPDWAWALTGGVLSLGWYFTTITAGTSYFAPDNGRPTLTDLQVWGAAALLVVQAAALLWAGRRPISMYWIVYGAFLLTIVLVADRALSVSVTLLFAIVLLIARTHSRIWIPTLGLAVLTDLAIYLTLSALDGHLTYIDIVSVLNRTLFTFLPPLLGGLLVVSQQKQARLETEHAEAQAATAVAVERTRMARELHDVTAHHLSALGMQTKAALRARELDEEVTTAQLDAIRAESERALRNLSDVIGLLRDDSDRDSEEAVGPTLGNLAELIASVRELHPTLDLRVEGAVDDVPPAASFACFRIIQESLTNVRKHAAGANVSIRVRREAHELTIEITNASGHPMPSGVRRERPGFGVLGMTERAAMLGGTLDAGRTAEGGWRTRAAIPLDRRRPLP